MFYQGIWEAIGNPGNSLLLCYSSSCLDVHRLTSFFFTYHSLSAYSWPGCFSCTGEGLEEIIYLYGIRKSTVILQGFFFFFSCFVCTYASVMLSYISNCPIIVSPTLVCLSFISSCACFLTLDLVTKWQNQHNSVFFDPVVVYMYIIFRINLLAMHMLYLSINIL